MGAFSRLNRTLMSKILFLRVRSRCLTFLHDVGTGSRIFACRASTSAYQAEWRAAAFSSVLIDKNIIVLLFPRSPLIILMAWVVGPSVWFGVTGFELGLTNQGE